jgi:ABC-type Fe3+/spermidine/putrescine transport system ATPase subunit
VLDLRNISVTLDNFKLSDISLRVERGDYFVIAGPSGSGKTILLETIAGIYSKQTSGKISLSGADLGRTSINRRKVGMVFQDNTLFPHLSVEKNIKFALRLHTKKSQRKEVFNHFCNELMLVNLLQRNPMTLSGGETQRVLIARTLASFPEIILLDEPLSGVDTHQKDQLKSLLRRLNRNGQTIIHVTHDFEEAYSLANKMGIMFNGRLIDQGTPEDIVTKPSNHFSARFCGYKNYHEVIKQENDIVHINDRVKLETGNKNLNVIFAVIIDETSINIAKNKQTFEGRENILSGKIRDYSRSTHGIELIIDAGIELHAIVPSEVLLKNNWQTGVELFLQIPKQAIRVISR